MTFKPSFAVGLALAACAQPPAHSPSAARTLIEAPESTESVAAPPIVPAAKPSFEKLRHLQDFREMTAATPALFVKEGYDVAFAPSANLAFVARKRGGLLVKGDDVDHARSVGAQHFDQVGLSSDGRYGFGLDDHQRVSVIATDKATVVRTIAPQGDYPAARFGSKGTLLVYDGCRVNGYAKPASSAAKRFGSKRCGIADSSADGRYWSIARPFPQPASYLEGLNAEDVVLVDTERGTEHQLPIFGTPEAPIAAVVIDPSSRRWCAVDGEKRVGCQLLSALDRPPEAISDAGVVHHTLTFDDSGDRVVYAIGAELHAPKTFFLHDFRTGKTRTLGSSVAPNLMFVGGDRLLEIGSLPPDQKLGATVYDLAAARRFRAFEGAETGGLWRPGATADRVLIGKERDDTRDLYWIALPN